ncbi:MAG: DUF4421 family protein [Prevotella sp.]|nr:DUF4421 family protein [Prevotella sp.]
MFRRLIIISSAIMIGSATVGADTDVCPQLLSDSVAQTVATGDTIVRKESIWKRVSDKLGARYFNSKYDSAYVMRPEGKGLTLKVRMNQTGNTFHAKGTINGIYSKADLSTKHKTTFSLAGNYRGIGAAIAINPAKWSGVYKDYELNLNYYGSRLSLDLSYQRSESLSGDIRGDRGDKRLETDDATLKVLNLVGYYTFNHRRFSYPAAFTQSYIQRRSAGSWLVGISYQGGSIKSNDELKQRAPDAPEITIEFGHIGLGGGYGYNLVLGRKWLLHASLLPTAVVYNRNKMIVNGENKEAQNIRFNVIFNERLAVVYNFSMRYFAGATLVMNNSVFDDKNLVVNQNKWRARAFIGVRF